MAFIRASRASSYKSDSDDETKYSEDYSPGKVRNGMTNYKTDSNADGDDPEKKFRKLVEELKTTIERYKAARRKANKETLKKLEEKVTILMNAVADASTDPNVARHYKEKAEKFSKAHAEDKENIAMDVAKGLGLILAAPFVLAAAGVFVAGTVVYGVGTLVQGIGNVLTFGGAGKGLKWWNDRKKSKDEWDTDDER